jgi:hypothetical protein
MNSGREFDAVRRTSARSTAIFQVRVITWLSGADRFSKTLHHALELAGFIVRERERDRSRQLPGHPADKAASRREREGI